MHAAVLDSRPRPWACTLCCDAPQHVLPPCAAPRAPRRLHRTYPESEYGYACPVPLLKAWQVDEVRASPWSPHRATFEPCRLAPYFRSEVHSYVFGALAECAPGGRGGAPGWSRLGVLGAGGAGAGPRRLAAQRLGGAYHLPRLPACTAAALGGSATPRPAAAPASPPRCSLSNVAYWHLAALPDLRFFKNTFSWLVGPRLGLCVAVNPCGGNNVFLGLQGLRSWHKFFVDCGHGTITLQVRQAPPPPPQQLRAAGSAGAGGRCHAPPPRPGAAPGAHAAVGPLAFCAADPALVLFLVGQVRAWDMRSGAGLAGKSDAAQPNEQPSHPPAPPLRPTPAAWASTLQSGAQRCRRRGASTPQTGSLQRPSVGALPPQGRAAAGAAAGVCIWRACTWLARCKNASSWRIADLRCPAAPVPLQAGGAASST